MQYLRADTITEVTVGPAVAVGDAFTPVTSLTIAGADEAELIKHGATTTTAIAGTLAAITGADGYYALDLSATDTNTEGRLTLLINDDSLILPIRLEFMVVNTNVFDALFAASGTDVLDVSVTEWLGTAAATPTQAGVPEVDVTFVSGVAEDIPSNTDLNARTLVAASYFDPAADTVALVTTVTTLTGHTAQTADHTAGIADIPTVAEFNARTILSASYFDPAVDTVVNVTNVATLTGHTAQTGDSFARLGAPVGASLSVDIQDLPTVAEFNARTLVAASYFDPAADTVVNVTNVATLTGHTVQTGDSFPITSALTSGAAATLALSMAGTISGAAVTGTLSTTQATTDLTGFTDDQFIGRVIVWTSGPAAGEATDITDSAAASGLLTFTALTLAPANTDTFIII